MFAFLWTIEKTVSVILPIHLAEVSFDAVKVMLAFIKLVLYFASDSLCYQTKQYWYQL